MSEARKHKAALSEEDITGFRRMLQETVRHEADVYEQLPQNIKVTPPTDKMEVGDLEFFQNNQYENKPKQLHVVNVPSFQKITSQVREAFGSLQKVYILTGAPGNGKTICTAFTFLECACVDSNQAHEYVWVNYKQQKFMTIVGKTKTVFKLTESPLIFNKNTFIVVFDGIVREQKEAFATFLTKINAKAPRDHRPIQMFITSEQTTKIPDTILSAIGANVSPKIVRTDPWKIQDYYAAVEIDAFWNDVKAKFDWDENETDSQVYRERLVDEKLPLAGTCARFMFDYTKDQVIEKIEEAVHRVQNLQDILNVGGSSDPAVNTITQFSFGSGGRKFRSVLVSDYVARCIGTNKNPSELEEFLHLAFDNRERFNPPLDGWLLELDFLTTVRRAISGGHPVVNRLLFEGDSDPSPLTGTKAVSFHSSRDFKWAADTNLQLHNDTWFIPEVFNQGGFDAVRAVLREGSKGHLHFFQVTRAETHSLKSEYLTGFLQTLNQHLLSSGASSSASSSAAPYSPITSFDVTFVVPTGPREFSLPAEPVFSERTSAVNGRTVPLTNQGKILKIATFKRTGEIPFERKLVDFI
jgi:hypothetical protein